MSEGSGVGRSGVLTMMTVGCLGIDGVNVTRREI